MSGPTTNDTQQPQIDRTADCARWWRAVFEGSEDLQFVCDHKGTIKQCNPRAANAISLTRRPSVANINDILTSTATKRLTDALARPEGNTETISSVSVLTGSQIGWLADILVTPLGGGLSLVSLKDAGQRWRMEAHLQRLVAAIDATSDLFLITNAEFVLIYANCALYTSTGYSIEEAIGQPVEMLCAPDDVPTLRNALAQVRSGADWMGEFTNLRRDGSHYPVEAILSPIHDKRGQIIGIVACERDITHTQRLKAELLAERDFVRSILNSLDAAVYTLDRDFRLTHANETHKRLPQRHGWLHLPTGPQIGSNLLDSVEDETKRAELQRTFESVLKSRQPQEMVTTSDGRHWSVKISPWLNQGEVVGLIYKVVDQSAYHGLQKQLYQSQKMETVGALAAGVAHDFNNFLQPIKGNALLLLEDDSLADPIRTRLEQIEEAASRAEDITHQLLTFSRASEEKIVVFDFNQTIQDSSQLARRSLRGNMDLHIHPAPEPVYVKMDPTRAHQLILNLCVNAIDAMPGGGKLTLTNEIFTLSQDEAAKCSQTAGTRFLRCMVADTGTGIPPEVLPRILDPFFTTKGPGKGTGLGLSIAHSIIRETGGFLDIKTEVGAGTTFIICLPLTDASQAPKPQAPKAKLAKGSGRILVVDDLDLVRDFTRNFLKAVGFDVEVVSDAHEAIANIEATSTPYDLVLTDFNMPGMNGIELITLIRSRWSNVKCILVSGYLEDEQRATVEQIPDCRVLNKPYNMKEAIDMIAELTAPKP